MWALVTGPSEDQVGSKVKKAFQKWFQRYGVEIIEHNELRTLELGTRGRGVATQDFGLSGMARARDL